MMKILILMGGFFPGKRYGGPPVSVDNFCALMKDTLDCFIVTQNHDMGLNTPYAGIHEGWNDRGNAKVKYVSADDYNSKTFELAIQELCPDYIYLQGLFQECVLPCLRLAQKYHLKVVLAPRGELCAGAFHKRYKKLPYITFLRLAGLVKNITYQSTSDEETEAIKKYLGADESRIHLLSNIPSIPGALPIGNLKGVGVGRFVFISRILWKKNLLMAINALKGIRGKAVLDIFGPKEDELYWAECEKAIKELPVNIEVNYCGVLSHDEIHATFSKYDAFLFPTMSENYGHVIAESLLSGCIPIISDQTPWNDINEAGAGWAIPLADQNQFQRVIQRIIDMDEKTIAGIRENITRYITNKLNLKKLKAEYLSVFK